MTNKYIFRKIRKDEVPQMFQLIRDRIKWMDQREIKQWNVTGYDEVYPQSYYEEERKKGNVYVLVDQENKEIVSGAILKTEDERWDDNLPALYIHNLVSRVGQQGVGAIFIQLIQDYALQKGKLYLRLDSAYDNEKLTHYYETKGFLAVGRIEEGLYRGVRRQKKLF